jgi:release factor glutamine methyltransferase
MNLKEAYRNYLSRLQPIYGPIEAAMVTDWVFEYLLQLRKADVVKDPEHKINKPSQQKIDKTLAQLLEHKPIQYVLGEAWFYKMPFKVNKQVLIPRPETEELVKLVLSVVGRQSSVVNVLDIGTGSGCIAVSLKKNIPSANITAIDISTPALNLAKENAATHDVDINFIKFDFLNESKWKKLSSFDIIVSNPPYIPLAEKIKLDKNVTEYEPGSALFVPDESPLLFYDKIARFGKTHLNKNGKILVETHEDFGEATAALFKKHYEQVEIKQDIFGKDRMLVVV